MQYGRVEFRPDFGSWNLKENRKFKTGAGITGWTYSEIQYPNQHPLNSQVKKFVEKLVKRYKSTVCAHQIDTPPLILNCTCPEKQFADLDNFFNKCRGRNLKTLLLILPDKRQTLFASIKYLSDVKYGVQTICIQASKMQMHIEESWYTATIAQKLNTKGGGINQCLPREVLQQFLLRPTMIVGIDVTNPFPKGQDNAATSIIGVVASKDINCAQWPASVRRQDNPANIALDLKEMIVDRLKCWETANKSLPGGMLIYRNSVTESHTTVVAHEMKAIENAIEDIYSGFRFPKVTIMTISKSHHTRFYPADTAAADGQSGNPKVGTVVDRVLTGQVPWDFYLQSHPGTPKSGTVCPAHYVVVKDDMKLGADGVQQLVSIPVFERLTFDMHTQYRNSRLIADCFS